MRSAKKREQETVNERFATALLSHKDRDFWSEVKCICVRKTCQSNLYLIIGRFVRLQSEGRTAGMPVMSQCQPYATVQHCGDMLPFSDFGVAPGRRLC